MKSLYKQNPRATLAKLRPITTTQIPVRGGSMLVSQVGNGRKIVLALHGVAGSHMTVQQLSKGLDDSWTLLAPDLRGRGASNTLPSPYGLDAHAADCERILEHFGVEAAVVAGHSMGAFVSELLAVRRPDQVKGLILIDGGLTFLPSAIDASVDAEQAIETVVGPILQNLRRTYATEDEYFSVWRNHAAFQSVWNEDLQARFQYDLEGKAPNLRSRISADAIKKDMTDALTESRTLAAAFRSVSCPIHLFRATRGIMDQPEPLISDDQAAEWISQMPQMVDTVIHDTNHVSITLLDRAIHEIGQYIMTIL